MSNMFNLSARPLVHRADDVHAHGDGARAVEDVYGHQGSMLRERMHGLGKPEILQGYHSL